MPMINFKEFRPRVGIESVCFLKVRCDRFLNSSDQNGPPKKKDVARSMVEVGPFQPGFDL